MAISVRAIDNQEQQFKRQVDIYPNECPICHYSIEPCFFGAYHEGERLQIVFKCPSIECRNLFLSIYLYSIPFNEGRYQYSLPHTKTQRKFEQLIQDISGNFCAIYNEAFSAEQSGLLQICGGGYRKALEFLIKDYLIKLEPSNEEKIKNKFLGKCIADDVKDEHIKQVAIRATWLGNDETHYVRRWENKDLQDLKKLIDLTIYWIKMEEETKEVIQDMPNP